MKLDLPTNAEVAVQAETPTAASHSSHQLPRTPVLQARQLFGIAKEVLIEHAGFTYRLRITQANKLLLTK